MIKHILWLTLMAALLPAPQGSAWETLPGRERALAVRELGRVGGGDAVSGLIQALGDPNVYVRAAAVQSLVHLGAGDADVDIGPALVGALDNANDDQRAGAAETLGILQTESAVPKLIALLEDSYPPAQHAAACALGRIGDSTALEPLVALLRQTEALPFARMGAAWALGELGMPESAVPLTEVMLEGRRGTWNYTSVYVYAAEAVGKIGNPESLPALVEALGIDDRHLREQLARVLETMTGQQLGQDRGLWEDYLREAAGGAAPAGP